MSGPYSSTTINYKEPSCPESNSPSTSTISTPPSTSTPSCSRTEPAKVKPGYANFAIAEPPLKLVLIEGAGTAGSLNHLGVEVESTDEVAAADARLTDDGLVDRDRGERRVLLRRAGQGVGRRTPTVSRGRSTPCSRTQT